jgi:uncharacterized protein (DUF1800 family)
MSGQYGSSPPPSGGGAPSPYDDVPRPSPYDDVPRPSPYDAPRGPLPDATGPFPEAGTLSSPPDDGAALPAARRGDDDGSPVQWQTRRERRRGTPARRGDPTRRGDPGDSGDRHRTGSQARRRHRVPRGVMVSGAVVAAIAAARGTEMMESEGAAPDEGVELSAVAGDAVRGASARPSASGGAGPSQAPVASSIVLPEGLDVEHLLNRVTYGPTESLRAAVRAKGASAWLAAQLDPASLPDPRGVAVTALFPKLALPPDRAETDVADRWAFQRDLAANHLGLACWSERQLFEVMVDFWSNHFNIPCPGDHAQLTRHLFDTDVIRRAALGRFEDLLQASAIHPAMLEYLDNGRSSAGDPNERYARVLLEHHTVGPSCGFTERDVRQTALLLTGFQVRKNRPYFVPSLHLTGAIDVLGFSHVNSSRDGGRDAVACLLHHLAVHPETARHLSRKLAVRFVRDDPPAALVERLAKVYLSAGTRIVPVLVALLSSQEFAESPRCKLRRPMERLTAAVRALGIGPGKDPEALVQLYWPLVLAGHPPYGCPREEGYADVAGVWKTPAAALQHLTSTARLARGRWPEGLANPGPDKLIDTRPGTRTALIGAVGSAILGRAPTAVEKASATALLASAKVPAKLAAAGTGQREAVALVAALLLNSPAVVMR